MRKKGVFAWGVTLVLMLSAGCAPGDISQYAARAQQAGEAIFGGETVSVSGEVSSASGEADSASEESASESEEMAAARTRATQTQGEVTEDGNATDMESAVEAENVAEREETAGNSSGTEELTDADAFAAGEEESADISERELSSGDTAQSADASAAEEEAGTLPAMMTAVEARVQAALGQKADAIDGSLAGRDSLTREQQEALTEVLLQKTYDDETLCLINTAQYEGAQTGSFLLFVDSMELTVRGKVTGDLWFYDGETATKVLQNTEFLQQQSIQCGDENYLLVQTQKKDAVSAQVYRVEDGKAVGALKDAVSVEAEEETLRVSYQSDHIEYDPVRATWTGGEAEITYFYVSGEDGLVQETVQELTTDQYLSAIEVEDADVDTQALLEALETMFYDADADTEEETCRYSFFAIGDEWIGYRECRIGVPAQSGGEAGKGGEDAGHVTAEYTYHLAKLEDGKLTAQCETLSGSGYYFACWDQQEEELEALSAIPAAWLKNRVDRAEETLRTQERDALARVLEVQEYDGDALCFVERTDYDGDGEAESFVAVGRYDGILCVPVCDLWFVSTETPVLLSEGLPIRNVFSYEQGEIALFLTEGFESDGARDRLYGVKDGEAQRLLADAVEIEVEESGDLIVKTAEIEETLPYYFYISDGTVTEYGVQETKTETLLNYENGTAVYRQLKRLADLKGGSLSCLERENGLLHVIITDEKGSAAYETYRVADGALVLVDCGDGGYAPYESKPEADDAEVTQ